MLRWNKALWLAFQVPWLYLTNQSALRYSKICLLHRLLVTQRGRIWTHNLSITSLLPKPPDQNSRLTNQNFLHHSNVKRKRNFLVEILTLPLDRVQWDVYSIHEHFYKNFCSLMRWIFQLGNNCPNGVDSIALLEPISYRVTTLLLCLEPVSYRVTTLFLCLEPISYRVTTLLLCLEPISYRATTLLLSNALWEAKTFHVTYNIHS